MARIYSNEEKRTHLDQYRVSGKCKTEYARENDIPEETFRAWIKEENYSNYGMLELDNVQNVEQINLKKKQIQ